MEQDIQKEPTTEQQESSPKLDENKIFGILSYISILCLIPLFTKKDDSFVYFHAKQGLVLFGFEVAVSVIFRIITGIFLGAHMGFAALGIIGIIGSFLTLINIGFAVLAIIGIINVFGGKTKKLPLIGSLADLIKF
ncbi:MAG: hypothetical protein PHG13_02005 [Candidatus Pacebacteria bacterium]|nr:hypothetical protein [Candidatus Paceibacterota bacterium]MDD5721754.1 hypothetical protein [Candidatus Paceibacterota bacterium]